jgi:hypothetical protein
MDKYDNISRKSSKSKKVSDKSRRESYTYFMFNTLFSPENSAAYDNVKNCGTTRRETENNVIRHVRFARLVGDARIQTQIKDV